jgi:hypothetical protein
MSAPVLRFSRLLAASLCSLLLAISSCPAQQDYAEDSSDQNSPSYTRSIESKVSIQPDLTATVDRTVSIKVLRESAIAEVGQQELSYEESVDPLEIVEAYTSKLDGRRVDVDSSNILTRDEATGLNAVYERDSKVKSIIYPDIEIGDTIVIKTHSRMIDRSFSGHFFLHHVLPRSVPYSAYQLAVDLPPELHLDIHLRGEGWTQESLEGGRHLSFTYRASGWAPEEPGAISPQDRDPEIILTTFKDFAQLGSSYWASMSGKAVVTPEIQALADTLTRGITDKHAQAEAIDRWVKKNIRYVLITLGSGGITPNPAPAILKNRYGDCKDHTVLMGALLKAEGIASEPALVNLGGRYRLPELPIPAFNHVMLYLPEFDLYDDPTASTAAFGVLSDSAYDKPVLHLSEAGGRLARTQVMKADEHVTTAKTFAFVGADGTVKGETRQVASGIFASDSRSLALDIQKQGRFKFAGSVLSGLKRPGTGSFDPAIPSDYSEPYALHGKFTLSEKLEIPLKGLRDVPLGMPVHSGPVAWFFGPRIEGRKAEFVCYAGKEAEEIDVTFAEGLPLPDKLAAMELNDKYFSFREQSWIEGRTLKIRRAFVSSVPGQVCGNEVEAEIAPLLQRVDRGLRAQMSFSPSPMSAGISQR